MIRVRCGRAPLAPPPAETDVPRTRRDRAGIVRERAAGLYSDLAGMSPVNRDVWDWQGISVSPSVVC
jgi:hypothetical protein